MSYFEVDAISQSYLKALINGGDATKQDETKSLTLGSIIDTLVTKPIKEFSSHYMIIDKKPSDTMQKIVHTALDYYNNEAGMTIMSALAASIEDNNYIGNKSWDVSQKLDKVLKEAGDYFDILLENQGKKFISKADYEHAALISTHISKCITQLNPSNEHIIYQKEIYFNVVYKDMLNDETSYVYPAKAMLDAIIIDYANKTILPIDVKYCSEKFEFSAKKYRYDIQASFYTRALQSEYPDYTIKPFTFVVGYDDSKTDIFQVTDFDLYVGEHGAKRIFAETYTPHTTIKNEIDILGWMDGVKLHHEITHDIKSKELIKKLDIWN